MRFHGVRNNRVLFSFLMMVWMLAGPARQLQAQVLYGSITGTVTDPSNAIVAGVELTLKNRDTNQSRSATTNDAGLYTLSNVLPGVYQLEIKHAGFRTVTKSDIEVTANTVRREDFQLQVGQLTDAVTVQSSIAALQTDKADVSTEIGTAAITTLPLNGYRNYQSLINLVPGATPGAYQNAAITRPGRALTTNINGTNRNNNITKLDGAVNISTWLPHHVAYVAPAETIETVNISTNNFDAEQGMAGGAAITVITKSGTNEMHGSLFAYHDNQHMRAWGFFETRTPQKPKNIRNIDGGTFGGPIKKNKLFYFGGWESTRERVSRYGLYTVPTDNQRLGNFSNYSNVIYDPSTGTVDGKNRQPFGNNIIPASRQSAVAQRIQSLIPEPNQTGVSSNFYSSDVQKLSRDQFDIKVNWNRTEKHTVWTKYSYMRGVGSCNPSLGAAGGAGLCDTGSGLGYDRTQVATVGHTWTVSPTMVVDGVLGFTRNRIDVTPPSYGKNYGLDVWKIPGTNGTDIRQSGMPVISVSGYSTLGDPDAWNPAFQADQNYNGTTNVGWMHGRHDLRFGFDVIRHYLNHWQPELGSGPRGGLSFGYGPTVLNGGKAGVQYNGYATFLLGLMTSASKSVQWETMNTHEWQYGFYVRDRWQLSNRTTAVLGLRYELFPLLSRSHTGIEFYDPATNVEYRGGLGGNPTGLGIGTSKKMFAPRIGLTHRISDKTVVRGGYGIAYNPMVLTRALRGSYPMTIDASFTPVNSYQYFGIAEQGIPLFSGQNPTDGTFPLPARFTIRTLWTPDGSRKVDRGYIESWNLIFQRELPASFVVSAGYVGTRTIRGFAEWNANNSAPGTGQAGQPFYQQFQRTAQTLLFNGFAGAKYHSLQTTVSRAFRGGLMLKSAYTWSKAMDMVDDDGGWASLMWNWAPVLNRNWALSGFDITHNLQTGFAYDLPFGKGKALASSGILSKLAGGWQLNGIFSAYSGKPFTVSSPGTSLNSVGNSQTADQVKTTVDKLGGVGPGARYYDPAAFAAVTAVRFGTSGRNIMRAPGVVSLDGSVFRQFHATERWRFEFRAESFNVTNTPQFGGPVTDVSNANFMKVLSASGQRQFRFGLRTQF